MQPVMICDQCQRTWPLEANYCATCGSELRVPSGDQWRSQLIDQQREKEIRKRYTASISVLVVWLSGIGCVASAVYFLVTLYTGDLLEMAGSIAATILCAVIFRAAFVIFGEEIHPPQISIFLDTTLYLSYIFASFSSIFLVGFIFAGQRFNGLTRVIVVTAIAWIISAVLFFYKRLVSRRKKRVDYRPPSFFDTQSVE